MRISRRQSGTPIAACSLNSPIMRSLTEARTLTDRLFSEVHPDAYFERPIPERHRILFYLGHLEAFDRNLTTKVLDVPSLSKELDQLFAFGIDPPAGELPQDQPGDWPSIEATRNYVKSTRALVDRAFENAPNDLAAMAVEHRLMHAETFTYILHNLPYEKRSPAGECPPFDVVSPPMEMRCIPAGFVTLGRKRESSESDQSFGWDNEFESHQVVIPSFAIGNRKITNGDYLEFVKNGGDPPHYWSKRNGRWYYKGFLREVPVPNDWPVYVSLRQAQAYAAWKGKSLPTEAQYHRAAFGSHEYAERPYAWGCEPPGRIHGNFDFVSRDLVSVSATPEGNSAFDVSQLTGNGWEWTSTPFQPFSGFEPSPEYPGYSANFFDGDHYVLKGGSCATSARLLRRSFRNWFRKDYPYAYATFRLVEN